MENLFRINGVSDVVDSKIVPPEKLGAIGAENSPFVAWQQRNRIVLGWIQAVVGVSMFNQKSVIECWKTLELHLSPRRIQHSQRVREDLRSLKKSDSETLAEYIIEVRMLVDSLTDILAISFQIEIK